MPLLANLIITLELKYIIKRELQLTYGPYNSIFPSNIIFLSFCPPQAWRRCTSGVWSGSNTDCKRKTQCIKLNIQIMSQLTNAINMNSIWYNTAYINKCKINHRGLLFWFNGLCRFTSLWGCANCSDFSSGECERLGSWMGGGNVVTNQVRRDGWAKWWTTRAQLESTHFELLID